MRPSQLLAAVVALSSVTAATSNVFDSINALADAKHMLFARQDNQDDKSSSAKEASTTDAPKETDQASETDKPTATKSDAKTTAKDASTTDKDSSDKASKTTSKAKVTNFGADVQAGGIQMVTPNPYLGAQYYKVGDWVTFAWNYTSLSITPSAIDILASCSVNQQTYTIAVNHSVQATDTIYWDTGAYKSSHPNGPEFVSETYTLLIYDAQSSVSATAKPGYLAPYSQFYFGMYTPQPYVNWSEFECANCLKNDAFSIFASGTTKVLFVTFGTTIASFLYFAMAFGII
ncbi:uncharacterized protein N0V89_008884 [Didymosphaeria variabile]|uniref:DUF7137 domain-containing protein n=1 Tax=Didymosphaeria variabile TaxID=1932322 RepID=A0A9W8XHA3_9PLEO|nr:uncharacterized protein N0V89_008884 [Didymosphaeria variabile]KAJ4350263.1 hypothetical protein N0V89_008884 [Didymosphaeria variabile]